MRREVTQPVRYKGLVLQEGYRLDLIIEDQLIIEVKSIAQVLPVHRAQLQSYLRLSQLSEGLLINFNVPFLREGIHSMTQESTPKVH